MTQIQKYLVILIAFAIGFSSLPMSNARADLALITKEKLKTMLDDPELIILDVRRGRDWKSSEFKIKGAVYAKPDKYTDWKTTYPKDKKIVLYCA